MVANTIYSSVNAVFQASFLGNIGRFPPRLSFFFSCMNYVFLLCRYIGSAYEGTGLGQVLPAIISIIVMAMSLPAWTVGTACLSFALLTILIMILLYVFLSKSLFYRHHSGLDDEDPRGPSLQVHLALLLSCVPGLCDHPLCPPRYYRPGQAYLNRSFSME